MSIPETLKVVIIGEDEVSRVLGYRFAPDGDTNEQGTIVRKIQARADGDNLDQQVTLEIFLRRFLENPQVLRQYFSQSEAFIITFSLNSRSSFNQIKNLVNEVVEAKERPCPIAIVGMQQPGPVQVTPDEAIHQAAKLKLPYFNIRAQRHAQVMGPFTYLAGRHLQAKVKRTWLSKGIVWFHQSLQKSNYLWGWIWSCFRRQKHRIECPEDPNTSEITLCDLSGQTFPDPKHQRRRSSASVSWTLVTKDEQTFFDNKNQHQRFYKLESLADQTALKHYRRQIPWPAAYHPDRCSSEEFLYLAQNWPSEHPYKKGVPSLWDIVRDNFQTELQLIISNFPLHQQNCDECRVQKCPELYRLIYMLLQDLIGASMRVRLNNDNTISATGEIISTFRLTKVQPQDSSIQLTFKTQTNENTFAIVWDEVWRLPTFGIEVPVPIEVSDILPLWIGISTEE